MLNRVLTTLHLEAPKLESQLLHDLQVARYVAGRDTSRVDVVADVAAAFGAQNGLDWQPSTLAERLRHDDALRAATDARTAEAQGLMQRLHIHGVPQLLALTGDTVTIFDGASLYHGAGPLTAKIREQMAGALAPA